MDNTRDTKYLQSFGRRVAAVRKARGLTQEALAEKTGVTALTIGYIEQGRQWPRIGTLRNIASALHIPLGELFSGV